LYRFHDNRIHGATYDRDADFELARQIAWEAAVLLKNDGILPLREGGKTAFIGQYAERPRYQGGGSSHVNSYKTMSALEAAPDGVIYARGFDEKSGELDSGLVSQALEAARQADTVVFFGGLPDLWESEGFDRAHMRLPKSQNALIRKIAAVQPNIVVVLHNGAPVEMPWLDEVRGLLEVYYGGDAVGGATVDLLYGRANPSGRLPETFPLKLEHNPSYLNFPGEGDTVRYAEGLFVGYRYYDKKKLEVLFPFGYGLSYTSFEYKNLRLDAGTIKDTETLTVSVDVTNTGGAAGKEVVQLYVSDRESAVIRPVKELKDFAKVFLRPGQTKTVTFTLDKRAFAYYSTELGDWHVETGVFDIIIAKSAAEPVLSRPVTVESTVRIPRRWTKDSVYIDIKKDPAARAIVDPLIKGSWFRPETERSATEREAISQAFLEAMLDYTPLHNLVNTGNHESVDVQTIVDKLNSL